MHGLFLGGTVRGQNHQDAALCASTCQNSAFQRPSLPKYVSTSETGEFVHPPGTQLKRREHSELLALPAF